MDKNNELILQRRFAFNVWDINSAKAIIEASKYLELPIFLQVSSKVFSQMEAKEFISSIKKYIRNQSADVIIHLDHSRDINQINRAIELGWDSVMYDGSHLPIHENINNTIKVVEIARKNKVLVEGEIGQVLGVEDDISVDKEVRIRIEDVDRYITSTNIDLLAVSIGTAHGQYRGNKPKINYDLLKQIGVLSKFLL